MELQFLFRMRGEATGYSLLAISPPFRAMSLRSFLSVVFIRVLPQRKEERGVAEIALRNAAVSLLCG